MSATQDHRLRVRLSVRWYIEDGKGGGSWRRTERLRYATGNEIRRFARHLAANAHPHEQVCVPEGLDHPVNRFAVVDVWADVTDVVASIAPAVA